MAHTTKDKKSLLARIGRLEGQLRGVRRAIEEEKDCGEVLHALAAFRGATNGLMLVLLEGHIRHHVIEDGHEGETAEEAGEELIEVLRKYLK